MSLERCGYVGIFREPLDESKIEELVLRWLERFGHVEQTLGSGAQPLTSVIHKGEDLRWEKNMQFRVSSGEQFAWLYLTKDRHVIETSGLTPHQGSTLCRDVLVDMPGCNEVIDDRNDKRLDQLEAEGLM